MGSEIADLLERIEAATGPDRALDADILQAIWPADKPVSVFHWSVGPDGQQVANAVTSSIDAALALVERCLPAANCHGFDADPKGVVAYVSRNCVSNGHWMVEGERMATPPLAILSALLRALGCEEG